MAQQKQQRQTQPDLELTVETHEWDSYGDSLITGLISGVAYRAKLSYSDDEELVTTNHLGECHAQLVNRLPGLIDN